MSLIRNSFYNIAGFAVPTLVAVPALGILARLLGPENFGLFTLAFALIGYASIFDAGISRAVIREISLYRESEKEQIQIISTASV
ncbi:TPA: oligosaccharide flippase family protein, partial [Escherichia coli]|nr:oligosaccharide flippase family protein [Escherichia coli]